MTENGYYTVKEFANLLKVHTMTLRICIKLGKVRVINIGTGKRKNYRIPYSELERMALFDLKDIVEKIPMNFFGEVS